MTYTIEVTEEIPFLARYFPNLFAEALDPANPFIWTAYLVVNKRSAL